jgi:hypothetical protein
MHLRRLYCSACIGYGNSLLCAAACYTTAVASYAQHNRKLRACSLSPLLWLAHLGLAVCSQASGRLPSQDGF